MASVTTALMALLSHRYRFHVAENPWSQTSWCCPGFKGAYQNAGRRGFTILVGRNELRLPEFLLQHRAIDDGVALPLPKDAPVYLKTQTGLRFCPWCGVQLEERYANLLDELHRPELRS